ncbi:MAG TPA: anti-sigma factor [Tepidisphaeraceae bacterium]
MPLLLLDGLEPAEAAALRAHLASGCARCASFLAEADATLSYLPYGLDPVDPSPTARQRLFDRIQEHAATSYETGRPRLSYGPPARRLPWMPTWVRRSLPVAVAACVTFVTTVRYMSGVQHGRDQVYQKQLASAKQESARKDQDIRELTNDLTVPVELIRSPSVKQIVLEGRTQPKAMARALWDPKRKAWHFYAYNLQQLGPKDAYELWFVTPYGRKVPASTFRPNELGYAHIVASLPSDVGPIAGAFVTDEPAVGTFQPTGETHLSGKLE